MSALARILGFATVIAAVFAAAALAGSAIDPSVDESSAGHDEDEAGMEAHEAETAETLPGLAVAASGYRLVPQRTRVEPGSERPYRFRIADADGGTVTGFDLEHERRMHLIVVRSDFAAFQHLHPRMRPDGTWAAEVDLTKAGAYRVFADFSAEGTALTLGTDLMVAGRFEPQALPDAAPVADAGDGYEVTLDPGDPAGGETAPARFEITRNGRALDAVEPYLGADGHLVALREHDQAYLHTHPEGEPGGSGPISFGVEYPTPGRYRLFLQFKHRGVVRTAEFTQEVGDGGR